MNKDDNHSEKVQRILEQKPAFIIRWGNTLLLIILLLLLIGVIYSSLANQ